MTPPHDEAVAAFNALMDAADNGAVMLMLCSNGGEPVPVICSVEHVDGEAVKITPLALPLAPDNGYEPVTMELDNA